MIYILFLFIYFINIGIHSNSNLRFKSSENLQLFSSDINASMLLKILLRLLLLIIITQYYDKDNSDKVFMFEAGLHFCGL